MSGVEKLDSYGSDILCKLHGVVVEVVQRSLWTLNSFFFRVRNVGERKVALVALTRRSR